MTSYAAKISENNHVPEAVRFPERVALLGGGQSSGTYYDSTCNHKSISQLIRLRRKSACDNASPVVAYNHHLRPFFQISFPRLQYELAYGFQDFIWTVLGQIATATVAGKVDGDEGIGFECERSEDVAPEEDGVGEAWCSVQISMLT